MRPEPLIAFDLYEPFLDCCHYGEAAKAEDEAPGAAAATAAAAAAAAAMAGAGTVASASGPSGAGDQQEEGEEEEESARPKTPPPTPDRAQRPVHRASSDEAKGADAAKEVEEEEDDGLPLAVVVRVTMPTEGEEGHGAEAAAAAGSNSSSEAPASVVTIAAAAEGKGGGGGGGPRATIALDRLSAVLSRLPATSWGQLEALLALMRRVAAAPTGGVGLHAPTVAGLGAVLGPLLARPRGAVHLSLRHARELPRLASLGAALIQHAPDLQHQPQQPQQQPQQPSSGGASPSGPASPLGASLGLATAPAFGSPGGHGHGAGLSPAAKGECGDSATTKAKEEEGSLADDHSLYSTLHTRRPALPLPEPPAPSLPPPPAAATAAAVLARLAAA